VSSFDVASHNYVSLPKNRRYGGMQSKHDVDLELISQMPRPRHIKSHLPAFLLPDQLWTVKPKVVSYSPLG
jgi:Sulfotransferase domain